MKRIISVVLAALLIGLTSRNSWSEEPDSVCQVNKLFIHLACMETEIDSPKHYVDYPRENFEFLVVICKNHVGKDYDIKVIRKEPTLVFTGRVKEETNTGLVMEFNIDTSYHFRIQIQIEKGSIIYPPRLDTAYQNLLIQKSMSGQLEFNDGKKTIPNSVYVRGYQPTRQCWGFVESEPVPIKAE